MATQSRIHERIRQLGEVIERARDFRQQATSSHNLMYPFVQRFVGNTHDFIEITRIAGIEGGESSSVGDVDVMENNNGIGNYKRNSKLVARALAIYPESSSVGDVDVMEKNSGIGRKYKRNSKRVDKEGMNFYDCNVCLEMAEDPILTCCGHLFCWVCFYKLLPQDSTSKECPVCMGEVSDNSVTPIYGNRNHCNSKTESTFEVPPRPKAQRIESGRQLRTAHGHLPEIPAPENSNYNAASQNAQIPLTTDGRHHQSHHQGLRVSSENSSSLYVLSTGLTDAEGIVDETETYIGARPWQTRTIVSDRRAHTLLPLNIHDPLLVNNALVQADNQSLNSTDAAPPWRTSDVVDADVQLGNLTNGTSSIANRLPQQSSSSTRRRSQRLLDAGRSSSQSRRRLP